MTDCAILIVFTRLCQDCKCKVTCAPDHRRVGGGSEGFRWDRSIEHLPGKVGATHFVAWKSGQLSWLNYLYIFCMLFWHISNTVWFTWEEIYYTYANNHRIMISTNSTLQLKVVCWESSSSFWRSTSMHQATRPSVQALGLPTYPWSMVLKGLLHRAVSKSDFEFWIPRILWQPSAWWRCGRLKVRISD